MPVGEPWLTVWNMRYWLDVPAGDMARKSAELCHMKVIIL
jgi:hypothetical protein